MQRYERQILIPQIGEEGQKKLKEAVVTVIGAGGLGSPVLTCLAMAGAGHIRCIDHDCVSLSNLNRQFLHAESDIGKEKTKSARETLQALNSEIRIETLCCKVTEENVGELIRGSQVVADCTDTIRTKCMISRACLQQNIPLTVGGIYGFYGFVTAICRESACLECMGWQDKKEKKPVPALGAVTGVIGSLQANECLKIILAAGEPLYGRILQYDGLEGSFDEIRVLRNEKCGFHKIR